MNNLHKRPRLLYPIQVKYNFQFGQGVGISFFNMNSINRVTILLPTQNFSPENSISFAHSTQLSPPQDKNERYGMDFSVEKSVPKDLLIEGRQGKSEIR
jgi:hypothetical protein